MSEPRPSYSVPLPPDLGLAISIVLSFHYGRANTISRSQLLFELKEFGISERTLREQIKQLRRSGNLIGSAPGETGGYYLITSAEELQDFFRSEYQAKINDMRKTVDAMNLAASDLFGPGVIQLKLL